GTILLAAHALSNRPSIRAARARASARRLAASGGAAVAGRAQMSIAPQPIQKRTFDMAVTPTVACGLASVIAKPQAAKCLYSIVDSAPNLFVTSGRRRSLFRLHGDLQQPPRHRRRVRQRPDADG